MAISEVKKVFCVVGNRDNTEGRGASYVMYVTEKISTAKRLGRKKGVQGSDCLIEELTAIKLEGELKWLVPGCIVKPSTDDLINEKKNILLEKTKKKAIDAGMTEEEINILRSGNGIK